MYSIAKVCSLALFIALGISNLSILNLYNTVYILLITQTLSTSATKTSNNFLNFKVCYKILQLGEFYSFVKEIKLYTLTSYIIFLFVKLGNIFLIKKIQHNLFSVPSLAWRKSRQSSRILEQVIDWSGLEFSQTFSLSYTRQWRHRDRVQVNVVCLKWTAVYKTEWKKRKQFLSPWRESNPTSSVTSPTC